jgi:alkylation response protein AidB-like acyl-CoA dehydrogenase
MTDALRYRHRDRDQADISVAVESLFDRAPDDPFAGSAAGWPGVGIPEEFGGVGGGLAMLAPVIEACGAAAASSLVPWTTGVVAASLLCAAADPPRDVLAGVAAASVVFSVPAAGASLAVDPIAAPSGRIFADDVLALGIESGWLCLPLAIDGTDSLVLVPPQHPGVHARLVKAMDPTRPWTQYSLTNLDVADLIVCQVPQLRPRWTLAMGVACALDSAGAARSALAAAVRHGRDRKQFGRPLGTFQAYQHRCASAYVDFVLAQSVAFRAANASPGDLPDYALAAAAESTRAATRVCAAAIQLHGAMGFTWESGIHRYLRRARANEILARNDHAARLLLASTADSRK